jgi:outer membrane protein W
MRSLKLAALVMLLVVFIPCSLAAEERVIFRGGVYYSMPTGKLNVYNNGEGGTLQAEDGFGPQVSVEAKFSHLLGFNMRIAYIDYDLRAKLPGIDRTYANQPAFPISLTLLFHPLAGKNLDWYIGPGISYDIHSHAELEPWAAELEGFTKAEADNSLGITTQTGLDIMFSPKAGLNLDLRYTTSYTNRLHIDPIEVGVGAIVRF